MKNNIELLRDFSDGLSRYLDCLENPDINTHNDQPSEYMKDIACRKIRPGDHQNVEDIFKIYVMAHIRDEYYPLYSEMYIRDSSQEDEKGSKNE